MRRNVPEYALFWSKDCKVLVYPKEGDLLVDNASNQFMNQASLALVCRTDPYNSPMFEVKKWRWGQQGAWVVYESDAFIYVTETIDHQLSFIHVEAEKLYKKGFDKEAAFYALTLNNEAASDVKACVYGDVLSLLNDEHWWSKRFRKMLQARVESQA